MKVLGEVGTLCLDGIRASVPSCGSAVCHRERMVGCSPRL